MATDYDTPRKTDEELHEESLEELKARRADAQSGQVDIDEEDAAENLRTLCMPYFGGATLRDLFLQMKTVLSKMSQVHILFQCRR